MEDNRYSKLSATQRNRQKTGFSDEELDSILGQIEDIKQVINEVKSSEASIAGSCRKHGVDMISFRRIIKILQGHSSAAEPDLPELTDYLYTPYEALCADIFYPGGGACVKLDFLPADYKQSLEFVLRELPERNRKILNMRYFDNETYEAIGDIYGVSKERVRQIINLSLRMLRHPDRASVIRYGLSYRDEKERIRAVQIKQEREASLKKFSGAMEKKNGPVSSSISIAELGLSVRAYNCLMRAGIKTVEELSRKSETELLRLRSFGRTSMTEVSAKMNRFYPDWPKCAKEVPHGYGC